MTVRIKNKLCVNSAFCYIQESRAVYKKSNHFTELLTNYSKFYLSDLHRIFNLSDTQVEFLKKDITEPITNISNYLKSEDDVHKFRKLDTFALVGLKNEF